MLLVFLFEALYIFAFQGRHELCLAESAEVDIINIYSVLLPGQIAWCFKWNDAVPQVVFPVSIQNSMEHETSWFQRLLYKYVVNSHQMQKIPIIVCFCLFYCRGNHEILCLNSIRQMLALLKLHYLLLFLYGFVVKSCIV